MHIKFLNRGTGSSQDAANYLLQDRDHSGELRASVEVLRGDPYRVAAVAGSLNFKHKYTSGIVAWAPEDAPTDEQISRVLDEFEATAWAGLEPERYSWSTVLHREKGGGCHVHIFAARVDLESGKSLNIAPPGWKKAFDPLRDWQNWQHGWARPDDLARQRYQQPGHQAYIAAAQLRAGLNVEPDSRALITQFIMQQIEAGAVSGRSDLVAALQDVGLEVPRQGPNYITVLNPESGQRLRLKGVIYGREFTVRQLEKQVGTTDREQPPADRAVDQARAGEALSELAAVRQRRAEYNQQRYGAARSEHQRDPEPEPVRGQSLAPKPHPTHMDQPNNSGFESLAWHLSRELGADAILEHPYPEPISDPGAVSGADREPAPAIGRAGELGRRPAGQPGWAVSCAPEGGHSGLYLDRWREVSHEIIKTLRGEYDRARNSLIESFAAIVSTIRAGTEAHSRANQQLDTANRSIQQATESTVRSLQTLDGDRIITPTELERLGLGYDPCEGLGPEPPEHEPEPADPVYFSDRKAAGEGDPGEGDPEQ